jgi:hypothetical protein
MAARTVATHRIKDSIDSFTRHQFQDHLAKIFDPGIDCRLSAGNRPGYYIRTNHAGLLPIRHLRACPTALTRRRIPREIHLGRYRGPENCRRPQRLRDACLLLQCPKVPAGRSWRSVLLKRPATSPISLGLIAAAFTRTRASPTPGSGIATSSIRNTDGGPNSVKRNDLMTS